jgi:alpha-1,3-rhamnosyl/mannosyltransferase
VTRRALVGVNLLWLVPGVVGGSEEYTTRLLAGIADQPPDGIDVVLFALPAFAETHPDLAAAFPTELAPVDGRHKSLRVAAESTWLARRVAARRVTVVHHAGGTLPVVSPRPAILTVHDLQPLLMPDRFSVVKRWYLRLRVPVSARRARLVLTPSASTAASVVEHLGVDASRLMVVAPGVTVGPEWPLPASGDVAARYGISGPFFVYPAITYPHKNHHLLLEAFAPLARRRPDVLLVLPSGAAGAEAGVRDDVRRLGIGAQVRRIGRVPEADLDWLLRNAVALAFPSRHEGFGLPVLEAMAVGCPVIAADATAIPEVAGDAGILLSPDDPAAWTAALGRVLDDEGERRRLVAAGRARAARFSWRAAADQLASAYQRVVGQLDAG